LAGTNRALGSALGKVAILIAIAGFFLVGMAGTVYLSLRSPEVEVPEVTGKNILEAEKILADAGLNVRRRASRYSAEVAADTVLDQTPRSGDHVKAGQTIAVVVSRAEAKEGESSVGIRRDDQPKTDNQNSAGNQNESAASADNRNDNANDNRPKRNTNKNKNANSNNRNTNGNTSANRNVNSNLNTDLTTNSRNADNRNAPGRPDAGRNTNARPNSNNPNPVNRNATVTPNANAASNRNASPNTSGNRNARPATAQPARPNANSTRP
jgi:hypothetical protein